MHKDGIIEGTLSTAKNMSIWANGFSDCNQKIFPQHPDNKKYMEGWLKCLGLRAGYTGWERTCDDPKYEEGYKEGVAEKEGEKKPEGNSIWT